MFDLFGNKHKQTTEVDYSEYINSKAWKKIRAVKLEQAHHKCERCGLSKFTVKLDVHHLTYERLGHERMEDLQVLCKECHEDADAIRVETQEEKKKRAALCKGYTKWIERGDHEIESISPETAQIEKENFLTFLYKKSGVAYSLDLSLLGIRDDYPNWKPDGQDDYLPFNI